MKLTIEVLRKKLSDFVDKFPVVTYKNAEFPTQWWRPIRTSISRNGKITHTMFVTRGHNKGCAVFGVPTSSLVPLNKS